MVSQANGKGLPTVVHMSFSGDFGGREKVAASLFTGMVEAGHDCRLYMVVEKRHGKERNRNLLDSMGDLGPGCRYFSINSRFSPGLMKELAGRLKADSADIIHCHCYKSLFYALLLRRLGMIHCAVFYTLHGLVLKPGWNSTLIQMTQNIGLRLCDGVIGCSREVLASSLPPGWSGKSTAIINAIKLPVDTLEDILGKKAAAREKLIARYGLDRDAPIVINVGRLCPQKNFSLYLQMIERMAGEGSPAGEANFLLLGNGAMEAELKAEAEARGIKDKVVFTGFVSDMDTVFSGADLLVQSSIWEGTPMCLLEAQSYGLPSVVPDVGGNADVVRDGEDGYLYPVGDLEALAARTGEYLCSESLRHAHGNRAFDNAGENFSIPKWVDSHMAFYAEVTGGAERRRYAR